MFHVITFVKPAPRAGFVLPAHRGRISLPMLARLGVLGMLVPLLSGCRFLQDTGNPPDACELPVPEAGWFKPPPAGTPDQQKKRAEVCQHVTQDWKAHGYVRSLTTQMSQSGDVIDWMLETSVAGSEAEPPPPMPPEALVLPEGVLRQQMELEDPSQPRGPDDSIPILRPDFAEYVYGDTGATSLDDWIQHYQMIGDPSGGAQHLYAGINTAMPNRGAAVSINSFGGKIESFSMSVHEMVVGCRAGNEMWQWVGIASSRRLTYSCSVADAKADAGPCDDATTMRLRAEFLTGGATLHGNDLGGWNDVVTGFIPARGIPYPLGAAFDERTISTVGGTQYESLYQIELKDDGNWWVGHNGHWLGYYPASLFNNATPVDAGSPSNLIATQACEAQWYGEVSADLKKLSSINEPWTWTPLGSGHFAKEGFSKASYLRDPTYLTTDASGTWAAPPLDPSVTKNATPYNPACYTMTPLQTGASPWDLFFYSDGPGANNPLCQ